MPPAPADEAPFPDDEVCSLLKRHAGEPGLLVAVSGGSDSLALLRLLVRWRALVAGAPEIVAATVDHGLRPESGGEAGAVGGFAAGWGVSHVTLRWDGPKPTAGIQAAARDARYALLCGEAARRGFGVIALAHTRDDQAETVLMRFLHGSGVRGLGGMAVVSQRGALRLWRPLLGVRRARLRAMLARDGVRWVEDPSNADARHLRPRLRSIMPVLAGEGLDVERLAAIGRKMQRTEAAVAEAAARAFADHVAAVPRRKGADRRQSDADRYPVQLLARDGGQQARPPFPADRLLLAVEARVFRGLPEEIRLRLLALCITAVTGRGDPLRAEAADRLVHAIGGTDRELVPVRRTLAGALVSLGPRWLRISRAPPRRHP